MEELGSELLIGIAATIITAILIWIFGIYRKTKINIPLWLFAIILGVVITSIVLVINNRCYDPSKEVTLRTIQHKQFNTQTIILDGKAFYNCDFNNCKLVINGTQSFEIVDCQIIGSDFEIGGNFVLSLRLLNSMYNSAQFKQLASDLLKMIQSPDEIPNTNNSFNYK